MLYALCNTFQYLHDTIWYDMIWYDVTYFCSAPLSNFVRGALQIPLIDWLIDWLIDKQVFNVQSKNWPIAGLVCTAMDQKLKEIMVRK